MRGETKTTLVLIAVLLTLMATVKGNSGRLLVYEQLKQSPFEFSLILALVLAFLVAAFLHATGQIDVIKMLF